MTKRYRKNRFIIEQLEQRLMFSADFEALPLDGKYHENILIGSSVEEMPLVPSASDIHSSEGKEDLRREILFIDQSIPDYQRLVDDMLKKNSDGRQVDVVLLDISRNGIVQISDTLGKYQDLDAVHVVSHGSDGMIQLGNARLTQDSLDSYAEAIESWGTAMTGKADLLFYGCNLAAGDDGRELMQSLTFLTGADVAASIDLTGNALMGGDWKLEYTSGHIETSVAFSEYIQENWDHSLAIAVDASNSSKTTGSSVTISHNTSGSDRLMLVSVSANPAAGGMPVSSVTYNGTALTLVGSHQEQDKARVEIYKLVAPDLGAHDVVATFAGNVPDGATVGVMTFTGVDQGTPLGTFASAGGTSATASVNVSSSAGELVFDTLSSKQLGGISALAGQTEYWNDSIGDGSGGGSTEAGAASVTMSWSNPGDAWAIGAVPIKAAAGVLTVDTADDVKDGDTSSISALLGNKGVDGFISLREAIIATNNTPNGASPDEIILSASTYTLSRGGTGEDLSDTGDLDITDSLIIQGADRDSTTINGGGLDRVFHVLGGTVTLNDLTVAGGNSGGDFGGGMYNEAGTLVTLKNVSFDTNTTTNKGGGIFNEAPLNLNNVSFIGNTSTLNDAAFHTTGVTVNWTGGLVTGNTATNNHTIWNSGAGGNLYITNVTMSGNNAGGGGVIFNSKYLKLVNSTIYNNTGTGISLGGGNTTELKNTIVAGNSVANASSSITSLDGNIDDDGTLGLGQPNDISNSINLLLGPLQDNGGPTQTHALLAGSDGIDGGVSGVDVPALDQRGVARDGSPDMGAYERASAGTISISGTVYTDEGTTNIGAGKTVRLLVNGASVGTTVTDASGVYAFSKIINPGDTLLVYVDQNDGSVDDGTTVSVSDGNDLTNLDIYVNHLITRNDDGGSMTNALLSTAKGAYSDAEILYSVAGADLTANRVDTEVYIPVGYTFAPGGNITADSVEIVGTFTGTANTYDIAAGWNASSGTFTANSSEVSITSRSSGFAFTPGASNYYDVTIDTNDKFLTLGSDLTVTNNFDYMSGASGFGTLTIDGRTISTNNFIWQSGYIDHQAGDQIVCTGDFTKTGGDFFAADASGLTITFSGNTDSVLTPDGIALGNIIINKTTQGNTVTLSTNDLTMVSGSTLNVDSGIFDIAGNNIDIGAGSTFLNTGTFRLQGGETVANLTNDTDSGVVFYNGGASYTGLAMGDAYYYLAFANGAGAWTLDAPLDVNANLTISSGTLDVDNTGNHTINLAGNWTNFDTFNARNGTVVFDGGDQSIYGSTTFNNFTKVESTNDATDITMTFDNTGTQTVNGTLTLDGLDADDRINLVSDSPGTQWSLVLGASAVQAIDYVDVTDSDASGSDTGQLPIIPANSIDGGNNLGWFSSATTSIGDGTAPSDRNVWGGGYHFTASTFSLLTDSGTDTLTDLTVTFSGTDVNDVNASGVKIWRDDGVTAGKWDESDTQIGSAASFSGTTAGFSGLSESINTSSTQYIITYDIVDTATAANILQGSITAATVSNTLVNNDNVDATLTVDADMVHETSVYKMVYSSGSVDELYLKNSSSPTTNILNGMSVGSVYAITPGSLIMAWDPDMTLTTVVNNSAVEQVQMSGRLMHSSGASYGTVTTIIIFYEDRIIFDESITMDVALTNEWMFMTYGNWDDALVDESFEWSSSNSGTFNTVDPASWNTGNQPSTISFQGLFEMGATDGLVSGTMQNISNFTTSQMKITDDDASPVDIAFQKQNPVLFTTYQTSVQYSFDSTTSGFNTTTAEERQDDFITPATLNFGIAGGDGVLIGDGYSELRGAYTLDDSDADDHVKFELQTTTTHHAPVFEISNWDSALPVVVTVDGVAQFINTDYRAAESGTTLYVQYLGNISSNTIIEIGRDYAPTDISISASTIDENVDTSGGSSIGTLSSTDSNSGDTFTYTLVGGADQGSFSIGGAGSDELILTAGILNFEAKSSYEVIVRTTDSGGLTFDKTITVTINDLNEDPTDVSISTSTIDENIDTSGGSSIGTLSSTDPDSGDTFTYSLVGGADQGSFSIGGAGSDELILTAGILNYEAKSSYEVIVRTTDSGGLTFDKTITVTVNDLNEDPTDVSISASTIDENVDTSGGSSIGTLSSTDPDSGDTFTYSVVGGAEQGNFSIGGAGSDELILTAGILNYEAKNSYEVIVRTTDSGGLTFDKTITVTVNDLNEDPTDVSISASTIDENIDTSGGSSIGTLSSSDPDSGDTFTYTLVGGADQGSFSIGGAGSDELILTAGILNFEAKGSYEVIVRSTDSGGLTFDKTITVTINDLNEDPTDVSISASTIDENVDTSGGLSIGTLSSSDPDSGDTFSYSVVVVGGADQAAFSIGGAGSDELILTAGILNFEAKSSYEVIVRTTDAGGLTFDKTITVTVNDLNEDPTDVSISASSIDENVDTSGGSSIGTLSSTDPDSGDTFTYTLVGGADQGNFSIGGAGSDELILTAGLLNFEIKSNYEVIVRTTDSGGLTFDKTITVTVNDLNEDPTDVSISASDIDENVDTSGGSSIGTLTSSDPDAGDTFTYSVVGGADQGNFSIGGAGSDELILTAGILNFEAKSSYEVIVRTTDSGGLTFDKTITVTVNDLNEEPTDVSISASTIDENIDTSGGSSIGTLTSSDPDSGDTFTYSVVGGADQGSFSIGGAGSDELILTAGILNYEAKSSYEVIVRSTDSGGLTFDKTITVTINDLNEDPTDVSISASTIDENVDTSGGSSIGTLS